MELKAVEKQVIREAQLEVYGEEITALRKELNEDVKFPIILRKRHYVTRLIVMYHHENEAHRMGINFTLNHLGETYYEVHGREMVRELQMMARSVGGVRFASWCLRLIRMR